MTQSEKCAPGFNMRKHTVGHMNHIHIGLAKAAAARRTSFWSAAS